MDTPNRFASALSRNCAGLDLTPHQQTELQRLIKVLRFGSRYQMIFVEIADELLRERLIARLDEALADISASSVRVDLADAAFADALALKRTLLSADAGGASIIHIVNGNAWLDDTRLHWLNLQRETLAHTLHCRLVFWLSPAALDRVALHAADLWSWRSGVYALYDTHQQVNVPLVRESPPAASQASDLRQAEGAERIPILQQWLSTLTDETMRLPLIDELATLQEEMGNLDEALRLRRDEELVVYERLGDLRSYAVTFGKIADILETRGELGEALRIRREEQLPAYEKVGDVRNCVITLGKIAELLNMRGQSDEALRILEQDVLPVLQNLGGARDVAVTMGKIADILQARGQFDEALRIREMEQLPVYQRLGDVRAVAVAKGKIADILQARRQFDEALRIRQDDELPVYQRLGDVRSVAITKGKIAAILQACGQIDEALRIRQNEQIPAFEKLGDVRALMVAQVNLAGNLTARGAAGDQAAAERLLQEALQTAKRLRLPDAAKIEGMIASLQAASTNPPLP